MTSDVNSEVKPKQSKIANIGYISVITYSGNDYLPI